MSSLCIGCGCGEVILVNLLCGKEECKWSVLNIKGDGFCEVVRVKTGKDSLDGSDCALLVGWFE